MHMEFYMEILYGKKERSVMEFIKGMDISMLRELEEYGAVYYHHGKQQDLFEILRESGVNLIRLRLWHNPYSLQGEPYGGGTNDFHTTLVLAKRAAAQGMKFMLNLHYSDFWTDPSKQFKPKAWEKMNLQELEEAVYQYTDQTLCALRAESVEPQYVQVGNELTNGLLWPEGHVNRLEDMARLLNAGISAVKAFHPETAVMLHLDFGTDNALYRRWFEAAEKFQLSYDIIGMSYYPYWNGKLELLEQNMADISRRFGKDILVAETAIGYTADSLGCAGMVYSQELAQKTDYSPTKQGQHFFLKELTRTIRNVPDHRGRGFIYWEPEWLPLPQCAWAKPAGCEYTNDKGVLGNSWGNQALFDEQGNANPALENLKEM